MISRVVVCMMLMLQALAEDSSRETALQRVESAYHEAEKAYRAAKSDDRLVSEFGRASFNRAEYAKGDRERAALAEAAIEACRGAVVSNPTNSSVLYYLALNLGQLARTKSLGALKIVREMEQLFLRVRKIDPEIDHAGPDRCLGLLYLEAPSWPTSIGNKAQAREALMAAARRIEWYPGNQLVLAEAARKWKDPALLASAMEKLGQHWEAAKSRLSGDAWAADWQEWEMRRLRLKQ